MEKLQTKLAELTARAKALDTKRAEAQTRLDRAVEAAARHKLEGDLENVQVETKLQSTIDSATSALSGFGGPMATLAKSIAEIETKLGAEKIAAACQAGSKKVNAKTDQFENYLGPWLELTRKLAAAAADVGPEHFEANQIGGYLRNCASEIEAAGIATIGSLRSYAAGIISGQFPIPQEPGVTQPAKPTPTPAPTTALMFLTQSLAWYDDKGAKYRAPATHDCELPLTLIAKARQLGAAHDLNSDVRRKNHGIKTSAPPEWAHCKWLNDDPKAKTDVEPILHSAFEKHPNVRPAYTGTMRQPQTGTATRSLPPGKK
jgi:hypothetical protein